MLTIGELRALYAVVEKTPALIARDRLLAALDRAIDTRHDDDERIRAAETAAYLRGWTEAGQLPMEDQ